MDTIQIIIDWASDQTNSNFIRTMVTLLAIPSALVGIYSFTLWVRRKDVNSKLDALDQRLSGTSPVAHGIEDAWRSIRNSSDASDYRLFSEKFAGHFLASQALKRIDEFDKFAWEEACRAKTADAFQKYLGKWPNGKWATEAGSQRVSAELAEAEDAKRKAEADAKQKALREEQAAWVASQPKGYGERIKLTRGLGEGMSPMERARREEEARSGEKKLPSTLTF